MNYILIGLIFITSHYLVNTFQQVHPDTQIKPNKKTILCYMEGNVTENGCDSCFFTILENENRTYLCEKTELETEKFIKYLHTKSRISNKFILSRIFGTCLDSKESSQHQKICWCRQSYCNWSYDRCCHHLLTTNKHLIEDIDLIGFNLLDLHFPRLFKETIIKFIFLFDIELKAIVYYWNS